MIIRIAIILSMTLSCATLTIQECANCSSASQADSSWCAIDGNLYRSPECARCQDTDNYEVFICSPEMITAGTCKNECAQYARKVNCWSQCGSSSEFAINCGSRGQLFASLCKASCHNPSLDTAVDFDCSTFSLSIKTCSIKCSFRYYCKSTFSPNPYKTCGTDSLIYDSPEELKCNLVREVFDFDGTPISDPDLCKTAVEIQYGKAVGIKLPKPEVFFPYKP
jgi:hypothetical protein